MTRAVEHLQVQDQHAQREQVKEDPKVEQRNKQCAIANFRFLIANCSFHRMADPVHLQPACRTLNLELFLPASFTADPVVPDSLCFQHFYAVAVSHSLFDLVMGEARADLLFEIRQFQAQ